MKCFILIVFFATTSFAKEVVNKILVTVNTEIVLLSDFKRLQERLNKPGSIDETLLLGEKATSLKNSKKDQLDYLIREKLVDSEIKKQNLAVGEDRVEAEMAQMAKKSQMTRSDFDKFILSQGFQIEEYKAILKTRIERQSFFESEIVSKLRITDEDALGEYQSKNPNYKPNVNEFKISQIFFSPKTGGAPAALARAKSALERIRAGESFEVLANQINEAPRPNKDGLLGSFRSGEFIPEIESAVSGIAVNEISDVIRGGPGYHIVKVLSKKTTLDPNFLKVKEMIKASLVEKNFQRQLKNWFETKKQDANIKYQEQTT